MIEEATELLKEMKMAITIIADRLSHKIKRKIQCFLITERESGKKRTKLIEEILKHGIKLA